MARGNQRDEARAKNLKKQQAAMKGGSREGDPLSRNEDDKAKLQEKIAKKAEMKKEAEAKAEMDASKGISAKRKEKKKEVAGLDDLLSAGISGGKKKK